MSTPLNECNNNFSQFAAYPSQNIEQQTFLGASVRSFSANGGFGDTSSTLSVDLAVDEFNLADETPLGEGQDVYHNGKADKFRPPPAGSPVFFTMGPTRQTVKNVFKRAYDQYYDKNTVATTSDFYNHFSFGGILQSYIQTRGPGGNPLYSAQVVDPREILSNVQIILNNYAGSVFKKDNIINAYGFLELNTSKTNTDMESPKALSIKGNPFDTVEFEDTSSRYRGIDAVGFSYDIATASTTAALEHLLKFRFNGIDSNTTSYLGGAGAPRIMTGTGFSRRSERGIPYYRIVQAINALFGHYGDLEPEHREAGFFTSVNFRGVKYAVDLSDLPILAPFHYFEYDQINLLDFIMEVCDTLNHDVFVTLLPVIDHPGCKKQYALKDDPAHKYEGVIKVVAIDKSTPFNLSAIKTFIDNVDADTMKNNDIGYELANNVVDKIVVGANEVENFHFRSDLDRVHKDDSPSAWYPDVCLTWSVMPYYGTIANKGVTVPVGRGAYQQILLDSSSVYAHGMGNFYVATELELRAASMSYETWKDFLIEYNKLYMEPVTEGDILADGTEGQFQVTVPRCAIPPISPDDGFTGSIPKNSTHPPYGYPLYYGRATAIGIPEAGFVSSVAFNRRMVEITTELQKASRDGKGAVLIDDALEQLGLMDTSRLTTEEKEFYDEITDAIKNGTYFSFIDESKLQAMSMVNHSKQQTMANMENVMRVYNFVKSVASECLGKKWLVKLPQECNDNWHPEYTPFGFPTRKTNSNPNSLSVYGVDEESVEVSDPFDQSAPSKPHNGALKVNKNVIANKYEFNYTPEPLGGYPSATTWSQLNRLGLKPKDRTAITGENGRIKPYVIYDHSQELDFSKVSKEDYTQQTNGDEFIPKVDYAHTFENSSDSSSDINGASILNAPTHDGNTSSIKTPTRAYVACAVENKLYMPPKFITKGLPYYGGETSSEVKKKPIRYTDSTVDPPVEKTFKPGTVTRYRPTTSAAGEIGSVRYMDLDYLFTDNGNLKTPAPSFKYETGCVYALITIPNRIQASVTSRYRTSQAHSKQGLYHTMLADVCPLFTNPEPGEKGNIKTLKWGVSEQTISTAGFDKAIEKTYSNLMAATPNHINILSGSPIVPDFISLPLMSSERCYGPWMSSYGEGVGGNIEFVKDESLAPWNYAGYKFMNSTGKVKAAFGSSAQFTSERGSFTLATGPTGGLVLGKALADQGPLITTINMEISSAGVSTVYKMDLFTKSFGKLDKQKSDHIAKMSRNQQKLIDERNALERKNMGKFATSDTIAEINKRMRERSREEGTAAFESKKKKAPTKTVVSTSRDKDGGVQTASSMLNNEQIADGAENIAVSAENQSRQYYNTVSASAEDVQVPASMEPSHPTMSSRPVVNVKGNAKYYEKVDGYTISQVTYWRT